MSEVAAAFALVGLPLWGASYTYASAFFDTFGVSLTEVGYNQQFAVTNIAEWLFFYGLVLAVLGVFALITVGSISSVLIVIFGPLARLLRPRVERWLDRGGRERAEDLMRSAVVFAVVVALIVPFLGFFWLNAEATRDGLAVRDRTSALGSDWTEMLGGVHLSRGFVEWQWPSEDRPKRSFVLFLGRADGQTVIWDYCTDSVIRLPTDSFVMMTPLTPKSAPITLDPGCRLT